MAREIHVGVIGAGYWGFKLVREYLELSKEDDRVRLSAVADSSRERLDRVAEQLNLPRDILYNDPGRIAESDFVDAVHIATPNETHYSIATMMLESGKHVFLEKPMALSSREAFRLARLSEERDRVLLVGHVFRFNNALRVMKEILERGNEVLYYMDLVWTTWMEPPSNRDIIFDLAPHPVDIINFLTNEWPQEVYTVGRSFVRGREGLEETAYSLMNLHGDGIASVKLSWLEYGPKVRKIKIVTDRSAYHIDALKQSITLYGPEENRELLVEPSNTIREMIRHFIDVIAGEETPNNSALIGALTVAVLEGMARSLKERKPVRILTG